MIEEEKDFVASARAGDIEAFRIDSTMTIVQQEDGSLLLHSPVTYTPELLQRIRTQLGGEVFVSAIIAPNLQHWLELKEWAAQFPEARVYVAPAAEGECLLDKLQLPSERTSVLDTEGSIGSMQYRLLDGAALMLNEVAFFHTVSRTLVLSDAFYSGYDPEHPPNAFTRVWFKVTKPHWSETSLPIYRTSRVVSNGDPDILLDCIRILCKSWQPESIVAAHGNKLPFRNDPQQAWIDSWAVTSPCNWSQ